jgi:uncharacterized protein
MKISGAATMHAPATEVWAALRDPEVLALAIPGCERVEPTGADTYRFTLTTGVAWIRGRYSGDIELSDQDEPSSFVLTASGAGVPGSVSTSVHIRLTPRSDGLTELTYDADGEAGGLIATVGPGLLGAVARRLVGDFFTAVDDALLGNASQAGRTGWPAQRTARGVALGAAAALTGVAIGRMLGRRGR